MNVLMSAIHTSLGVIEDLVKCPFPNILKDLPMDTELAMSSLQIKRGLIDYELNVIDEELTDAKNRLSQLTESRQNVSVMLDLQHQSQTLFEQYLKWRKYASQRTRLLKKLTAEVNLRLELPEFLHKGVGIWTETDQKLASTPFFIESENNKSESSDAYVK